MMTPEQFEQTLRLLLSHTPYQPITVVLQGGTRFQIDDPRYVARAGGVAAYISADQKLVFFDHEDVAEFIPPAPAEAVT